MQFLAWILIAMKSLDQFKVIWPFLEFWKASLPFFWLSHVLPQLAVGTPLVKGANHDEVKLKTKNYFLLIKTRP